MTHMPFLPQKTHKKSKGQKSFASVDFFVWNYYITWRNVTQEIFIFHHVKILGSFLWTLYNNTCIQYCYSKKSDHFHCSFVQIYHFNVPKWFMLYFCLSYPCFPIFFINIFSTVPCFSLQNPPVPLPVLCTACWHSHFVSWIGTIQ